MIVSGDTVRCRDVASDTPIDYPLLLSPSDQVIYLTERPPMDIFALFRNPMVLMMVVTGIFALVLPKLIGNMNPEELAEMKKMQKSFSLTSMAEKLQQKQHNG